MSSPDLILETLDAWPDGICDACLKDLTDADFHQYINATCHNLEAKGYLKRRKSDRIPCGNCGKVRVLNVLTTSLTQVAPASIEQAMVVNAEFMDCLRRKIIQYLNTLNPATDRESFSKRVIRLRDQGLLPGTIASLFLTHAAYRNEIYYKEFVPSKSESKILVAIDDCIRQHLSCSHRVNPERDR